MENVQILQINITFYTTYYVIILYRLYLRKDLESKMFKSHTLTLLGSYRVGKDTWVNAAVRASDVYDAFEGI